MWLPVVTQGANALPKAQSLAGTESAPGRVLVAEDEIAVAALIKQQLEQAGHTVILVGTGDEAMALL